MKRLSNKVKILSVLAVCAVMVLPSSASAGLVSKVLVDGVQYVPGNYTLDLDLTGKTDHVEFEIVNGDGTRKTMVSSVKMTLGSGKEKVVVISPDQFKKRVLSNVFGTIGEDVVNGATSITLDLRVGGSRAHMQNRNGDGDDDGDDDGKARHKTRVKKGDRKVKSIQLFVREYYQSTSPWDNRPSGW